MGLGTWLVKIALVLAPLSMLASPISPRLSADTQKQIVDSLVQNGMSEVATSSVLRTLESVLLDGKKNTKHHYSTEYDHFPIVKASSRLIAGNKMRVHAKAWMKKDSTKQIKIRGTFQKTDNPSAYEWKSSDLKFSGQL